MLYKITSARRVILFLCLSYLLMEGETVVQRRHGNPSLLGIFDNGCGRHDTSDGRSEAGCGT